MPFPIEILRKQERKKERRKERNEEMKEKLKKERKKEGRNQWDKYGHPDNMKLRISTGELSCVYIFGHAEEFNSLLHNGELLQPKQQEEGPLGFCFLSL